jgi:hypothetical protein
MHWRCIPIQAQESRVQSGKPRRSSFAQLIAHARKPLEPSWCMIVPMQVLVDADNIDVPRLRLLVAALHAASCANVVVAGAPAVLDAVDWPPHTQLLPATGWQGADLLLARAYRAEHQPLLLATGDGDFAQLARRHPGPVLLVSSAANRSHNLTAPNIFPSDPALDGGAQLRAWLAREQRCES